MAGNQFYTWGAAPGANVLSNSAFYALTTLRGMGFQPGIASSEQVNTVLRQTTTVAAALGELVKEAGIDAVDNGDPVALCTSIIAAIRYAVRNAVPVGAVIHSYSPNAQEGFLPLLGGVYARASYPNLFAFASDAGLLVSEGAWPADFAKFSSGDGSSTFRVPNLSGVHLRITDSGRGFDPGRALATYQADQMPAHSHTYREGNPLSAGTAGGSDPNIARSWSDSALTGAAGAGTETRVKNVSLHAYIKY